MCANRIAPTPLSGWFFLDGMSTTVTLRRMCHPRWIPSVLRDVPGGGCWMSVKSCPFAPERERNTFLVVEMQRIRKFFLICGPYMLIQNFMFFFLG